MVRHRASVLLLLAVIAGTPAVGWSQTPVGEALRALQVLEQAPSGSVAEYVVSPAPAVRLALVRMLTRRPGLADGATWDILAGDSDPAVATAALLGAVRAQRTVIAERLITSEVAWQREASAAALLAYAAVVELDGGRPLDEALLSRARAAMLSDDARAWSDAIDTYREARAGQQRWLAAVEALNQALGLDRPTSCGRLVRANPALLSGAQDAAGGVIEVWPPTALIVDQSEDPLVLLLLGNHGALADVAGWAAAEATRVARLQERVEAACSAGIPSPSGPSTEPPRVPAGSWDGAFAARIGVSSMPMAFRDARPGFLVGEDLELTVAPRLEVRYRRGQWEPGWALPEDPVAGGLAVTAQAGGLISSSFFPDRTRPTGRAAVALDAAEVAGSGISRVAQGPLVAVDARLLAGERDVYHNLALFPAPQLLVATEVTYRRDEQARGGRRRVREARLTIDFAEHLWDDPVAPHREERWLEPALSGRWLFGSPFDVSRWGIRGAARLRLDPSEGRALAQSVSLAAAWSRDFDRLRWEMWLGAGLVAPLLGDASAAGEPIAGLSARFRGRPEGLRELRLGFAVEGERDVTTFGRGGYVGPVERGLAELTLGLNDEMRDDVALRFFYSRADFAASAERLGWGGFELYIPIGLVGIDQEISYLMRYSAVIDTGRFGNAARELFEAVLTAGVRF